MCICAVCVCDRFVVCGSSVICVYMCIWLCGLCVCVCLWGIYDVCDVCILYVSVCDCGHHVWYACDVVYVCVHVFMMCVVCVRHSV